MWARLGPSESAGGSLALHFGMADGIPGRNKMSAARVRSAPGGGIARAIYEKSTTGAVIGRIATPAPINKAKMDMCTPTPLYGPPRRQ